MEGEAEPALERMLSAPVLVEARGYLLSCFVAIRFMVS
jgi:hypothetical protein